MAFQGLILPGLKVQLPGNLGVGEVVAGPCRAEPSNRRCVVVRCLDGRATTALFVDGKAVREALMSQCHAPAKDFVYVVPPRPEAGEECDVFDTPEAAERYAEAFDRPAPEEQPILNIAYVDQVIGERNCDDERSR